MATTATTGLQLRSLVKKDGTLELSLTSIRTPEPSPEEVVVRIDASPINPSDQGLLFGGADPTTARLPIIIVSAKATETDRVLGLEMGADDYLVKPFSPRELVARVRSVLRRAYEPDVERAPQVYEKGRLKLDLDTYEVFVDGQSIDLSLREFELLRFFVRSPNRVYDRLQLLDLVWGQDGVLSGINCGVDKFSVMVASRG
jgi:CheY-like chemotaxis protein